MKKWFAGFLLLLLGAWYAISFVGNRAGEIVDRELLAPLADPSPVASFLPAPALSASPSPSWLPFPEPSAAPSIQARPPRPMVEPPIQAGEGLGWFYRPQFERPFAISDPRYDAFLLKEAKEERDPANPWREWTFKKLQVGHDFASKLRPLKDPERVISFDLKIRRRGEVNAIVPQWIRYRSSSGEVKRVDYDSYFSPRAQENSAYVGSLVFPYDEFWKSVEPGAACDEILLLYDGIASHQDVEWVTGFDGRVFCLRGAQGWIGIAHYSGARAE